MMQAAEIDMRPKRARRTGTVLDAKENNQAIHYLEQVEGISPNRFVSHVEKNSFYSIEEKRPSWAR